MKYNFLVGASAGQPVQLDKCLVVAVLAMRKCGNNVESIKLLRHAGKVDGLREAKELSEFISDQFEFASDGTMGVRRVMPMVRWTGTSED